MKCSIILISVRRTRAFSSTLSTGTEMVTVQFHIAFGLVPFFPSVACQTEKTSKIIGYDDRMLTEIIRLNKVFLGVTISLN